MQVSKQVLRPSLARITYHDDEGEAIIEYEAKRMLKFVKSAEVRGLHDGVCHGLDDEGNITGHLVVRVVQSDKGLQKANDDNKQEGKENDGLLHHHFKDDQHCSEKPVAVQVQ